LLFFSTFGKAATDSAVDASTAARKRRASICFGCQQNRRDQEKQTNRLRTKMRDNRRRHASRLKISVDLLEEQYGWNLDRMEHDAEHAYRNGCPYCTKPFREMEHGYSDLTVDVVNPGEPPHWATNIRFVCMTCNREKAMTPSTLWAEKLACWDRWQRRQEELSRIPPPPAYFQSKLF
jgi:hypothetical protein